MNVPLLSICIPTFNREAYLKECLESLKASWVPDVEIVVSDNASTDGTIKMLEDYARQFPLRWQRLPANVGPDRNFASVVSMARGRYCWLLGSDDCVPPDSLKKIINQLREHNPDIFHFGYVQADRYLQPLYQVNPPSSEVPVARTGVAATKYLRSLPNVSMLFAFMSSFVFRRENWIAYLDRLPSWLDSHYVHAYMLHTMLKEGGSVLSSNDFLVIARGYNPNEWNVIPGKLLALDAITLQRVHQEIYADCAYLKALGCVFKRTYPKKTILSVAAQGGMKHLLSCQPALVALGYSKLFIHFLELIDWLGFMPILAWLLKLRRTVINNFISKPLRPIK